MLFFVWMVGILGFGVLKIDAESSKNLRTYNVDPTFSRWPDKANILYYIDPYYSVAEANAIRTAAKRVMDNLYGCVNFVETTASDARYKIHVSPYNEAGVLQTFCYTFPGQNNNLVNAGAKEQLMTITRGTYGCFDGTLHTLMKYFAIVLGKRNEHQRGDREDFIRVIGSNIVVPNSYRLYNISEAYWKQFPYDYCSITHNQQTDYASPGTVAFTVLQAPYTIPKLDSLSNTDCKLISMIYNCPTTPCTAVDCAAAQNAASSVVPPVTTTAIPATTTCPGNVFCTSSPDESSYLEGPYQFYQTLMLFKGNCVMEYMFDFTRNTIVRNTAPQAFASYFSVPGTFNPPVDLAYMKLDLATSGTSFTLNMDNALSKTELTCSTDPALSTNADTCPTAPSTTGAIVPLSKATSASSQIYLLDGSLFQYVVPPGNTEIGLMDANFNTLYSKTSNFLGGQNSIKSITAIQILQDQQGISNTVLGVFGVGADGVTSYVGYANMLLTADPVLALTDPVVIQPAHWVAEPKPLNQVVQGC